MRYAYLDGDLYPVLWQGRVSVFAKKDKLARWIIFDSGQYYILQVHWPTEYEETTEQPLTTCNMSAIVQEVIQLLPQLVREWKEKL